MGLLRRFRGFLPVSGQAAANRTTKLIQKSAPDFRCAYENHEYESIVISVCGSCEPQVLRRRRFPESRRMMQVPALVSPKWKTATRHLSRKAPMCLHYERKSFHPSSIRNCLSLHKASSGKPAKTCYYLKLRRNNPCRQPVPSCRLNCRKLKTDRNIGHTLRY